MKQTISFEFDTVEDQESIATIISASDMRSALIDINHFLRGISKYGEAKNIKLNEQNTELFEKIYENFLEIIKDNGLNNMVF